MFSKQIVMKLTMQGNIVADGVFVSCHDETDTGYKDTFIGQFSWGRWIFFWFSAVLWIG